MNKFLSVILYTHLFAICSFSGVTLTENELTQSWRNANDESTYQTLKELKNETFLKAGEVVKTLGYNVPHDGGGAEYTIKTGYFKEDGGSVIALKDSFYAILIPDEEINAMQFGCNPNWDISSPPSEEQWTSYDNVDKIQNALNYCTKMGRDLYVPSGVYMLYFKEGVTSSTLKMVGNTTIKGDGESSVLVTHSKNKEQVGFTLLAREVNNFEIRDICLDGNRSYYSGDDQSGVGLLRIQNAKNWKIENVHLENSDYLSISVIEVQQGRINNCNMKDVDCGVIFQGNAEDITIEDNIIDGHSKSEGVVLWQGNMSNIVVRGNVIRNKSLGGGIVTGHKSDKSWNQHDILITNNVIEKMSGGIWIRNANDVIVKDNQINSNKVGVKISNSHNVSIQGNEIKNSESDGIYIYDNSSNTEITENAIINPFLNGEGNSHGYIRINEATDISITKNDFKSQQLRKTLKFDQTDRLIFKNNSFTLIGSDEKQIIYINTLSNINETNCVKNSVIEFEKNVTFWNYYYPQYDSRINNSNSIRYSTDEFVKLKSENGNVPANAWTQHFMHLNVDVLDGKLFNIPLKPKNEIITLKVNVKNKSLILSNQGNVKWLAVDTLNRGITKSYKLQSTGYSWLEIDESVTSNFDNPNTEDETIDDNRAFSNETMLMEDNNCYSSEQFKTFPNPTNGILYFELQNHVEPLKIRILNTQGALMFSKKCNFQSNLPVNQLDMSNLDKGVYFVNFHNDCLHFTKKVILI